TRGSRRSSGYAGAGHHRRTGAPDVPRARCVSAGAGPGGADALGPYPWRAGEVLRLLAGRSLDVRQPLRLRPCGRARPAPHRHVGARVLETPRPRRNPAGDCRRGARWMTGLPKIGKPAMRALAERGITTLEQLTTVSQADLAAMHGVGPKAVRILEEALTELGKSFKQ